MKRYLLFILMVSALCTRAQYDVTFQTSFRNWMPGQGWVTIDNDSLTTKAGLITRSVTAGVPVAQLETIDFMLGAAGARNWLTVPNDLMGHCDKIMISPPITLGSNPYAMFYTNHKVGSNLDLYVITNPADTTLAALTSSILAGKFNGFNVASLNNWANTTVRLAFRLRGLNTYGFIDNITVFNKTSLGYVPDSSFRAYLRTVVPHAFTGDSLDYLSPDVLTATRLTCPNSNIRSLDGLQYFPFLETIDFTNNRISYVPSVNQYYLDTMRIANNLLTYLPDMPYATYVDISNNVLKKIPDIFNNYAYVFYASNNVFYDCLAGTNRFVNGNFSGNGGGINFGGYVYYTMTCDYDIYQQGHGPQNCSYTYGNVHGKVYYDANQNGVYDTSDFLMNHQRIDFYQSDYSYTDSNGRYGFWSDTGNINLAVTQLPPYFTCSDVFAGHLAEDEIIGTDFRVVATSQVTDLGVSVSAYNIHPVGGILEIRLSAKNYGTTPKSGTVKMYLPPGYTQLNTGSATLVGDTLVWPVTINPFADVVTNIGCIANYPGIDTLRFTAYITCPGDANLANNTDSCKAGNIGWPHDPNSKTVRTPQVQPGFSDYLDYTINFENTGTASAHRVMIRDYLSHKFNFSTFELTGSTSPCTLAWGHDSLPEFVMDNLNLTPNSVDSFHSRGSVSFRVKPLNPILAGQSIGNMAAIYFDTVAPVNTQICLVWAGTLHTAFNYDTVQCGTSSVAFTDVSPGTVLNRQWLFPGAIPDTSSGANPLVKYSASGTYPVTLIVHTLYYTDTLVKNIQISLRPYPNDTITSSGNGTICQGDSVILSAPSGPGYTYKWYSGETTQSIIAKDYSGYNVTVTDGFGCSASQWAEVVVSNPNHAIVDSSSCQSTTAKLTVPPGISHYLWSTGDTTYYTNVSQYGTYSVRITDNHGCIGRDTFNYAYHNKPVPVIIGDSVMCSGYYLVQTSQNYSSYLWSQNNSTAPGVYISGTGVLSVTVTDSNGCVGVDTFRYRTYPSSYLSPTQRYICKGQSVTLSADTGFRYYYWSTGETTRTITPQNGGSYTVSALNNYGCLASTTDGVSEFDKYNLNVTATVAGNCPGSPINLNSQYNQGNLTAASSGCTSQTATIGTGSVLESVGLFSNFNNYTSGQLLYRASELNAALGGAKLITQLAFNVGAYSNTVIPQNLTIYMGYTSDTALPYNCEQGIDPVYFASTVNLVTGWNTFTLNTPFYWNGTSSIVIKICSSRTGNYSNTIDKLVSTTLTSYDYTLNYDYAGGACNAPTVNLWTYVRPNVRFNYCTPLGTPVPIETQSINWYSYGGTANIANIHAPNTTATGDSVITFVMMVSDTSGCKDEDSVTISASALALVNITANHNYLCHGDSAQICISAASGTFSWNTGDTSACIKVNTAGTYKVAVNQGGNCIIHDSLTIHNTAVDSAHLNASLTSFCAYDSSQICVTSGLGNYTWSNGSTSTCISVKQGGIYSVTIHDAHGCSNKDSLAIHVFNVDSVGLTASKTVLCPTDTINICAPSGLSSYMWSTTETSQCINATSAGAFDVTVTDAHNCTAVSGQIAVTATALPTITSVANLLTTTSSGTYQWYLNDSAITGANAASYTALVTGNYSLQVIDTNGCTAMSDTIHVTVTGIGNLSQPVVVKVYPNPSAGIFNVYISQPQSDHNTFTITDILGRVVYTFDMNVTQSNYTQLIDLSSLADGVYMLSVQVNGNRTIQRIVKQKQ